LPSEAIPARDMSELLLDFFPDEPPQPPKPWMGPILRAYAENCEIY
jgi:hypothetical protein